jgi:ATP-dependent Clp protease ATP-binding subunit ClpX
MTDIMYELPEYEGYEVVITEDVVKEGQEPIYIKTTSQSRDKKIA